MGRVINTNSPTKLRNNRRRLIAELLTRMGQKQQFDDESKDMAAAIVYALRDIYDSCMVAAQAWEKRDYWIKAERFLNQWEWANVQAANLEDVIREKSWDLLPQLLMELFPHFADVQVKTLTKKPVEWNGAYARLLEDEPRTDPYQAN